MSMGALAGWATATPDAIAKADKACMTVILNIDMVFLVLSFKVIGDHVIRTLKELNSTLTSKSTRKTAQAGGLIGKFQFKVQEGRG